MAAKHCLNSVTFNELSHVEVENSITLASFNGDKFLEAISVKSLEISSKFFLKESGKKKGGESRLFMHPLMRQGIDFCTTRHKSRSF